MTNNNARTRRTEQEVQNGFVFPIKESKMQNLLETVVL